MITEIAIKVRNILSAYCCGLAYGKVHIIYQKWNQLLSQYQQELSSRSNIKKEKRLCLKQDVSSLSPNHHLREHKSFLYHAVYYISEKVYILCKSMLRNIQKEKEISFLIYPLRFVIVLQTSAYLINRAPLTSSSPALFKMIKPHFSINLNHKIHTLILEAN